MPEMPVATLQTAETRVCSYRHCKTPFKPKNDTHLFHTTTCRMKEWEILHPRLSTEQDKKREGMERAARHYPQELLIFRELARELSLTFPEVTIDDVRKLADLRGHVYSPGNWMGSVFLSHEWLWLGRVVPTTHIGGRSRMIKVWRRK